MTWHRPGCGWCRGVMPRRTLDCPRGGGGGGDRTHIGRTAGGLVARGLFGGAPSTLVLGASGPGGGGVALACGGLRSARPGRGLLGASLAAQTAGGLLRAPDQGHSTFHGGADGPGAGGAFGDGVGLSEQSAGDDPAGGGVIAVHGQPAARAVRPLPPPLTESVGGRVVGECAQAAGAEFGGAPGRDGDDRDPVFAARWRIASATLPRTCPDSRALPLRWPRASRVVRSSR